MAKPSKKIYLINRDFQLRYAYAAVLVGLASTALTAVVLLYPLYVFEILRIPRFLPVPILGAMAFAGLLNIGMIGFLGVFFTHRIAGPMYSLVRCFRRVELGGWAGHLRVRESDDMKFVVRNFNQMIDGLVDLGRTDVDTLHEVLSQLDSDPAAAKANLSELTTRMERRLKETKLDGRPITTGTAP